MNGGSTTDAHAGEEPAGAVTVPCDLFSTEGVRPQERFDAWRDSTSVLFDVTPLDGKCAPGDFRARLAAWHLGELVLIQADFERQRFERAKRKLVTDGIDHYQVQLYASGALCGSAGERERRLRPGDIQILDLGRPSLTRAETSETIALFVPRDLLHAALPGAGDLHGTVLRGDDGAGGLLADHMISLLARVPAVTVAMASAIAQASVGLIAACLRPSIGSAGPAQRHVDDALLERLKRGIEQELAAETLGPDTLCRRFGLSRARLYRLFEPLGGVAAYIRERRLARAMVELTSVSGRHRRVIDVAMDWGFASEAHFSRQFRRSFGLSPREVRARRPDQRATAAERRRPSRNAMGSWISALSGRMEASRPPATRTGH